MKMVTVNQMLYMAVLFFGGLFLPLESVAIELTLEKAVKIALENNSEIQLAKLELEIKDSQVKREIAAFIPTFSLDSSYISAKDDPDNSNKKTKNQNYEAGIVQKLPLGGELSISANYGRSGFSAHQIGSTGFRLGPGFSIESFQTFIDVGSSDNFYSSINLFYRQSLLKDGIFGPIFAPIKESRLIRGIQKEVLNSAEINLVKLVETTFYQTALREREKQIYQEILKINRQLLKDLKLKESLGMIPEIDVLSAKIEVNEVRESVLSSMALLDTSMKTLKTLLNTEEEIKVLSQFKPINMSVDSTNLVSLAMTSNPELAQLNKILKKEELLEAVARNRYLPQVDFYASLERRDQGSTVGSANDLEETEYTAGIVFIYPFYPVDPQENYRQTQKRVQQIKVQIGKTRLRITNEINMLYRQIKLIEKKIFIHTKQLEILKERMDLALKAFKERLIDLNIVYDIQDDRISGEQKYFTFLFEYQSLLASIKELTGEM